MNPNSIFENIESFEKVSQNLPFNKETIPNGREIIYVKKQEDGSD
jgi:hypothetical protein